MIESSVCLLRWGLSFEGTSFAFKKILRCRNFGHKIDIATIDYAILRPTLHVKVRCFRVIFC